MLHTVKLQHYFHTSPHRTHQNHNLKLLASRSLTYRVQIFSCSGLESAIRPPRVLCLATRYALFICARATHARCRPEAVPQRADNCVTQRNTATDPDALATPGQFGPTPTMFRGRECIINNYGIKHIL